uniref:Uncharacterized protein n=1 Tax=Rhizophora mucronata TaxID=61149 RepID=A0A2P2QFH3_RHIMU
MLSNPNHKSKHLNMKERLISYTNLLDQTL